MSITLDYLKKQAIEHPEIRRNGFLSRHEVRLLTGRAEDTIKKDEQARKIKRNAPDGAAVYDIAEVHAYLTRIGYA